MSRYVITIRKGRKTVATKTFASYEAAMAELDVIYGRYGASHSIEFSDSTPLCSPPLRRLA